jgi:hypothetical protein
MSQLRVPVSRRNMKFQRTANEAPFVKFGIVPKAVNLACRLLGGCTRTYPLL